MEKDYGYPDAEPEFKPEIIPITDIRAIMPAYIGRMPAEYQANKGIVLAENLRDQVITTIERNLTRSLAAGQHLKLATAEIFRAIAETPDGESYIREAVNQHVDTILRTTETFENSGKKMSMYSSTLATATRTPEVLARKGADECSGLMSGQAIGLMKHMMRMRTTETITPTIDQTRLLETDSLAPHIGKDSMIEAIALRTEGILTLTQAMTLARENAMLKEVARLLANISKMKTKEHAEMLVAHLFRIIAETDLSTQFIEKEIARLAIGYFDIDAEQFRSQESIREAEQAKKTRKRILSRIQEQRAAEEERNIIGRLLLRTPSSKNTEGIVKVNETLIAKLNELILEQRRRIIQLEVTRTLFQR